MTFKDLVSQVACMSSTAHYVSSNDDVPSNAIRVLLLPQIESLDIAISLMEQEQLQLLATVKSLAHERLSHSIFGYLGSCGCFFVTQRPSEDMKT